MAAVEALNTVWSELLLKLQQVFGEQVVFTI
jgi:hypothetical protein